MIHSKKYSFVRLFSFSILISLSFILVIHVLSIIELNQMYNYIILFFISLIFSTTLFYIINKQQHILKSERERLLTLFQHVSDGIIILDGKEILEMNQAAKDLLDNQAGNLFCDVCQDFNDELKICEYDKCFLNNDKLSYYELHLRKKSGEAIPVSISTSTFISADEKQLVIVSLRNLSEYRKSEHNRINNMIAYSMIKAQEEERKRLSRELHDGIGQSIFSIQLGLEYLNSSLNSKEAKIYLENLKTTTKQTLEGIRHMAVELRPSVLDDLGLVAALKSYMKTYTDTFGVQINFNYTGDKKRLPSMVETALYRITQEALINVAKYADAERVDLGLTKKDDFFILKIQDYGKGFSVDDIIGRETGVGLYSMEERAAMLNGSFHISSQIGIGTEIEVRIPIDKEDTDDHSN